MSIGYVPVFPLTNTIKVICIWRSRIAVTLHNTEYGGVGDGGGGVCGGGVTKLRMFYYFKGLFVHSFY